MISDFEEQLRDQTNENKQEFDKFCQTIPKTWFNEIMSEVCKSQSKTYLIHEFSANA